jgi:hypothetical protein
MSVIMKIIVTCDVMRVFSYIYFDVSEKNSALIME